MYRTEPLFKYAEGLYTIMPAGLPENFYPNEADRVHKTERYVICFNKDMSSDIKKRFIKDYEKEYNKEISSGVFR